MLINGIRGGTHDMFGNATRAHDKVVIVAGGVGIISYVSLLHAVREHSASIMMGTTEDAATSDDASGRLNNGEYSGGMEGTEDANLASMIVENHLRLIHNDVDDEYYDDDEYLERGGGGGGGGDRHFDDVVAKVDDGRVNMCRLDGDNDAVASATAGVSYSSIDPATRRDGRRSIDVHWVSRDEGLIRHVLANYLEPFCHANEDHAGDGSTSKYAGRGSDRYSSPSAPSAVIACPIYINVIVHHTSPQYSSVQSPAIAAAMAVSAHGENNNNNAVSNSESMGTWQPCHQHREHGGGKRTAAIMSVASVYDGNKRSPLQNILPAATYATIVFGGMYIVQYCYANIQDKHVVQTRPIAVLGILAFSMAVSLVSYGMVLVWEASCVKFFSFRRRGDESGEGGDDEVEFGRMVPKMLLEEEQPRVTLDGRKDDSDLNGCHAEEVLHHHRIIRISHKQGRPDLAAIIGDAMMGGEARQQQQHDVGDYDVDENINNAEIDLGIFMCGPTEMTDSVWRAIKKVEGDKKKKKSLCNGSKSAAVYQEVFEL
jgi:hypothetical protein